MHGFGYVFPNVFERKRDMTIQQLRYMIAVAENGSITEASKIEYSQARAPVRCRLSTGAEITLSTT